MCSKPERGDYERGAHHAAEWLYSQLHTQLNDVASVRLVALCDQIQAWREEGTQCPWASN